MTAGNKQSHFFTVLQALLVTFLWSTSFIIIKNGLVSIPPLTFAGLRYSIAFLCFIPFIIFKKKYREEISNLNPQQWKSLILLGFLFYAFTQGAQFLGLSLLPSVTVSLLLNFTPIIVAVAGFFFLNEKPAKLQWLGSALFIAGIIVYFFPVKLAEGKILGILIVLAGVMANAASAITGRRINKKKDISPLIITFLSMGTGSVVLLISGISLNGFPEINTNNWLWLIWLAVINTALAFTLWNHTLRTLTAMESSIINGTMLMQIAVLAWYFLDEIITLQEALGMLTAAAGAVLVQLKKSGPVKNQ